MAWTKPEASKGGNYVKIEDGENRVRIVSEPVEAWKHFVEIDGKKTVRRCAHRECAWCAKGDKAKKEYSFLAIARAEQPNGEVAVPKLLSVGQMVYSEMFELMTSSDWCFDSVPHYDVVIKKTGAGMDTRYVVQPTAPKPLRPEDAAAVEAALPNLQAMVAERYGESDSVLSKVIADVREGKGQDDEISVDSIPF